MTTDERSADQSAEAQVRAYWEVYVWHAAPTTDHLSDCGDWYVDLLNSGNEKHGAYTFPAPTKSAAWDAALAFTLEHQEQCRCLGQEIFSWNEQIDSDVSVLRTCHEIDPAFACSVGEDLARVGRTVDRLQAALSELRRGVKEKA